ncbi:hypothetical protein MVLG_01255 [Microbotryum lychnidis-dioicae p1A1 Lamole]|uniref:Helix-turn-helix domain-containing protein n=1 Tax=Microbotryum lychnidis-dioicae (strain p1A1 Lamole / MvSl-1064) TaxID=683840 RepID=U5H1J9_USTV1|nr:hypothetical protein MVLG_01255 [Microbotryum lychnidis-dioicae p1A1 Lamole]|eukprot:KDE08473.1 hypothetical protein MVLG_01255 [Microbotryum lychnidis-dioicae p1A1 Lamole]
MKKPKLLNPFGLPFPTEVQRLLSNNIKFIPRPHIHKMNPLAGYDRLERSVRTNYLFRKAEEKTGRDTFIPKLHVKSLDWSPPRASLIIEKGLRLGRNTLLQAVRNADPTLWRPNLSISTLRSLGHLMIEHDFIVKASDKNLGLTVLPREWYINEALRQLSDTSTYTELDPANHDAVIPTLMSARYKLVSKVMSSPELFRIIPKSAEKFLLQLSTDDVKLPEFHLLPKLHKKAIAGRPIVPSYAWVTSHVSIFIDTLLQPILQSFPWIIRDSKDLLRKLLELELPDDEVWIVTADIRSMYTNIPSTEGANVVAYLGHTFYETNQAPWDNSVPPVPPTSTPPPYVLRRDEDYLHSEIWRDFCTDHFMEASGESTTTEEDIQPYSYARDGFSDPRVAPPNDDVFSVREFLQESLLFVLNNSFIGFQNRVWHQTSGTAMGTAMAPAYANLFVGAFERELDIPNADNIVFYGRYIDDVIAIIKGPRDNVDKFAQSLNDIHPNLVFDFEISNTGLPFLDAFVSLNPDPSSSGRKKRISTKLYQKPLNTYQYIPWSSFHPVDVKLAFVKGELIRYIRLNSSKEEYLKTMLLFYGRLRARGYPPRWLKKAFSQVQYDDFRAKSLLVSQKKDSDTKVPLFFVTKYNPIWDQVDASVVLNAIVQDWDPATRAEVTHNPKLRIMRSRSRAPNLGDIVNALNKKVLHGPSISPDCR